MAFTTHAFGQFYKLINPTNIPAPGWYTASFIPLVSSGQFDAGSNYSSSYGPLSASYSSSGNKLWMFSSSFVNYPGDPVVLLAGVQQQDYQYLTTRWISSSAMFRDQSNQPTSMSAVPWGSQAGDFLWNVATPSWSFVQQGGYVTWIPTWTSHSFHSTYATRGSQFGIGTSSHYPATSSWKIFDPKYLPFQYNDSYPSQISSPTTYAVRGSCYQIHVDPITGLVGAAAGLDPISNMDCFNQVNNAVFDLGGGAAITQLEVANSLSNQDLHSGSSAPSQVRAFDRALRTRRLYFPLTYSASGEIRGYDYWLHAFTGYKSTDMFTENGGIYSVRFTLKRWNRAWVSNDSVAQSGSVDTYYYDPATSSTIPNVGSWDMATAYPADGSFMTVFIHDVQSQAPAPSSRVAGVGGWYPPQNNIVVIGNGYDTTPIMTFEDAQTGYLQEQFEVILVQYGHPAQLCFEPSGSAGAYWGCIISDVEVCKIGVTQDPRFIKPESIAEITAQRQGYNYITSSDDQ